MLERLFIENFALIDRLDIGLHPGFNVLTGETGAGKSIIIDAVSVVLGGQGLTEFIRSGQKKALIEAVFNVQGMTKVQSILADFGYQADEGDTLILTRELVKVGNNICRINGRQTNLTVYRDITRHLVDIYGQHHQQSLLESQHHIDLLDSFGGEKILGLKNRLAVEYDNLVKLEAKIKEMAANELEQARLSDYYKFQLEEIDRFGLFIGEDSILTNEKLFLANAEKLVDLANSAYRALYEGDTNKPAIDLLYESVNALREISLVDENIKPLLEILEASLFQAEEAARDIKNYAQHTETDPDRLEVIENRLSEINKLKRKYGKSIEDILIFREQAAASLAIFSNFDEELAKHKSALADQKGQYDTLATELSALRKKAGDVLKTEVSSELKELNMPYVSFDVKFDERPTPGNKGYDEVEFLISPNKGEPLKPLAKIVSGGEASRIMLAFRTILAGIDAISTLIFDEIDAGIGGQAIHAVAKKLAFLGSNKQVICVTHSPQIAGAASFHYSIKKTNDEKRTYTQIYELNTDERLEEIARMLNGGNITDATKKHAEEILHRTEIN